MKLREVQIQGFRTLDRISIPLDDITVFIGENNSGKTAILDAIRLILTPGTLREKSFRAYDYRLANPSDSPYGETPIQITLHFHEDQTNDWHEDIIRSLAGVVQLDDPKLRIYSIHLRVHSFFDKQIRRHDMKWEFLNAKGEVLKHGPDAVEKFLLYVPAFYLSALRDAVRAFATDSELWGRLIRSISMDQDLTELLVSVEKLNQALLAVDPRLKEIAVSLQSLQDAVAVAAGQSVTVRAIPQQPWELLSRSDVTVRTDNNGIDFPLERHGQGTQSLAVLFLFQAFVKILLKETFDPYSQAILALEEPEAHLHPHSVRSLGPILQKLPGQKLVSTHSPYFVQDVPLRSIRRVVREGSTTGVHYLKEFFCCDDVPPTESIVSFCRQRRDKAEYDEATGHLKVTKPLTYDDLRSLLKDVNRKTDEGRLLAQKLTRLQQESTGWLGEGEMRTLENHLKRIRGDVLFARAWILCEGPGEYPMIRYLANLLGKPLDQAGISVVDFQNNGSTDIFIGLAQALVIPWVFVSDRDSAGDGFKRKLANRGIAQDVLSTRVFQYTGQYEDELAAAFADEVVELMKESGTEVNAQPGSREYVKRATKWLRDRKVEHPWQLVERLRQQNLLPDRVPTVFRNLIEEVSRLANA